MALRLRTPGARALLPATRSRASGQLEALLSSPVLGVRLMTALQVLQVRYQLFTTSAAAQDEAEENDATEEEMTRERTTRVGRPRGGMKVAARSGERLRREIGRGRLPRVGDG